MLDQHNSVTRARISGLMDVSWNQFDRHCLAEACWMDDNGETFCYSLSQEVCDDKPE